MRIAELDTPALLVDLDALAGNLSRVASYAKEHGFRLRPHTKTHKTPEIGRMQLDAGAVGLTVAKVGEAEAMAPAQSPDLLLAYPVWGQRKLERLMAVARQTQVTVSLDSLEVAQALSDAARQAGLTIGVLVEENVGMDRTGLAPGASLVSLARQVQGLPGLNLLGLHFYPGHIWPPHADYDAQFARSGALLAQACDDFRKAGLPLEIVSGGSTPTLFRSHEMKDLNELRPGTYVFNDCDMVASGFCGWEHCAAAVLVTVVSTPRPGFAIVDGGTKTFSSETVPDAAGTSWGRIVEDPAVKFYMKNEEHGYLDLREASLDVKIGDRLRIIPNHICVTVNLHEKMYGIRGDAVEQVFTVAARGKLQ
ncbi:MAG: D-TA family PLP-dependent enzyme [Acidobacteria bacterium]|nr:D-TA family PLP-dependent enzyme [Acidobacteriota bacterium]